MARTEITSPDAERIAKSFNDLIGPRGLDRIRRKAVNEIGSGLRKGMKAVAPALYGTTAAALQIQGRAASPGSENPEYRLLMARSFPVGKLRAPLRKMTRGGELTLTPPHQSAQRFGAVERVGPAYKLLARGTLPARFLAGVATRARLAFADPDDGGLAELAALRRRAGKNLPKTVAAQITEHLKRRRR